VVGAQALRLVTTQPQGRLANRILWATQGPNTIMSGIEQDRGDNVLLLRIQGRRGWFHQGSRGVCME